MSDKNSDIWDGCFYRNEGGATKDILCSAPGGGEIPATIIDFKHNEDFLIATQKPKIPGETLYSKTYEYDDPEAVYYWILVRSPRAFVGPLSLDAYLRMRAAYGVPDELAM